MALPADVREAAIAPIEHFCSERSPDSSATDYRVEYTVRGNAITLVERRAPWQPGPGQEWSAIDLAQLRYVNDTGTWSLYWPRAGGRWMRYDGVPPTPDVAPLLAEVDADPDGVFWG